MKIHSLWRGSALPMPFRETAPNPKKVIEELGELSKAQYVCPSYLARIYIGLDDKDRAIEWLEKAYEERSTDLVWLRVDPGFDALRSDPRFQDPLRRMNFPE